MKRNIGIVLLILFMIGFLAGCEDKEELEKRIVEAEQRLVLAEKRAEMAEQRALLVEKQRDEIKQKAIKLGYINEDWQ